MAERLHAIVKASAPTLSPKTWYGMPAYAKDGKVVCFFQSAQKFKTRYATLGFSDEANLDEGAMWPTAFALKKLTAADEARIGALVKRAVKQRGDADDDVEPQTAGGKVLFHFLIALDDELSRLSGRVHAPADSAHRAAHPGATRRRAPRVGGRTRLGS